MTRPLLHEPGRHAPLDAPGWDEAAVRAAITRLVAATEDAWLPEGRWPVHPRDEAGDTPAHGFQGLYLGSAGVWWALARLQQAGAVRLRHDPVAGVRQAEQLWRRAPDMGQPDAGLFCGEAGILLARWHLDRQPATADRLFEAVRRNAHHLSNEAFVGAGGTLAAAWQMARATQEPRWRALFADGALAVWQRWQDGQGGQGEATPGLPVWQQLLYGRCACYLGAGHGAAGQLMPLLQGIDLLPARLRPALLARCTRLFEATALRAGDALNWPPHLPHTPGGKILMQWCHGAPGIISALTVLPAGRAPALDALLLAAGEAVWQAGPLAKGCGLCHGTAGNGEALLALWQHSGDARWLARARAFAMHALAQQQAEAALHGQGRHSLWTGDPGLALFLWHCITGRGGLPGLHPVDD